MGGEGSGRRPKQPSTSDSDVVVGATSMSDVDDYGLSPQMEKNVVSKY